MGGVTGVEEQLLVGGQWVDANRHARFDVTNPADGTIVGSVPDAEAADVARAIDAATDALEEWRSAAAIERSRVLRDAAELMRERKDEIAAVMTAEQGKPLAEAAGEVDYAASFLEWFSGEAERVYGQLVPPLRPAGTGARAAAAGRRHSGDHAVELPRRDADSQARAGDGGRVHERGQARERNAADGRDGGSRDRGGRGAAGGRQPRYVPLVRHGRPRRSSPTAACARSRSRARPRSASG